MKITKAYMYMCPRAATSQPKIKQTNMMKRLWRHAMETRYRPFVRGIHRSPVDSPHKGPVTQTDVFFDVSLNK